MHVLFTLSLATTVISVVSYIIKTIQFYSHEFYLYIRTYGFVGLYLPFISSSDVWRLVRDVLQSSDDTAALSFKDAQVRSANMVAVTVRLADQKHLKILN